MTDHDERWAAVGVALSDRMKKLGLTKAELLRTSGLSFKTLSAYLGGAPIVRADKARELALALDWEADAIERLLAGDEPVEALMWPHHGTAPTAEVAALAGDIERLDPADRAVVNDIVQRLLDRGHE